MRLYDKNMIEMRDGQNRCGYVFKGSTNRLEYID